MHTHVHTHTHKHTHAYSMYVGGNLYKYPKSKSGENMPTVVSLISLLNDVIQIYFIHFKSYMPKLLSTYKNFNTPIIFLWAQYNFIKKKHSGGDKQ